LSGEPDMSLFGVADILASFLEQLDLTDVTLVAARPLRARRELAHVHSRGQPRAWWA
jgi:hypothetical protein